MYVDVLRTEEKEQWSKRVKAILALALPLGESMAPLVPPF